MNNSTHHSITNEIKKRVPMFLALLFLAGMIVLNVTVKEPLLEPDAVHPMANASISWEQTFHAGGWTEASR